MVFLSLNKFENTIENGGLPEWMDETLGAFIRSKAKVDELVRPQLS